MPIGINATDTLIARNFKGVKFELLRETWDVFFNTMHDELEVAYYGSKDAQGKFIPDTGWRNGKSSPVFGLDCIVETLPVKLATHLKVRPAQTILTVDQSKQLFDLLHGAIWQAHQIWLHRKNAELAKPYPEDEINPQISDGQGGVIRRVVQERQRIDALNITTGINIISLIQKRFPQIDLAAK